MLHPYLEIHCQICIQVLKHLGFWKRLWWQAETGEWKMGDGHGEFESGKGLQVLEAAPESSPFRDVFCFGMTRREDVGEIGGSGVHFPLHIGETPSGSSEEQNEQPTVSAYMKIED